MTHRVTRSGALLLALAAGFGSIDADAFSFLCNGVDASGAVDLTDFCGDVNDNGRVDAADCTPQNAARWDELQADFRFDDAVRPPEESLSEWQQHQAATIAGWNTVQGHQLTLRDAGAAQFRSFGVINSENSIFWITNRTEFTNEVNGSPNSILGVTLAPYNCSGSRGRGGIADADIVMNGTGVFNWDQNSVVSTLTHEVGHAIGFGHPCTDCSNVAIMSATSGFNESDTPLFDDQEAIRSLYPGTPGGLGTACSADNQCTSGPCVTVPINGTNRSFCSQTCTSTCQNGLVCTTVAGEGDVCVFSNASIADIGAACGPPGCVDECTGAIGPGCNVCTVNGAGSNCFAGCTPSSGAGCSGDDACSPFGCNGAADCGAGGSCQNGACTNIGVCVPGGSALRGQSCSDDVQCVAGVTCVTDGAGANGVCLGLCNGTGSGCLSTETCLFLFANDSENGACFGAGTGVEGDTCADFDDCGRGLICLGGTCAQRCDRGFSCNGAQTCTAIASGNGMQFCSPVGGAEGEGEGEAPECLVGRGNFDCPAGQSCDGGDCVVGGEGPNATFTQCADNGDCSGGLCVNGVCTRPCDVADGCPAGYSCDNAAVDGGLCVPDSCNDNEAICDDDFTCVYSPAQRYVCAKGTPSGICNCTAVGDDTTSSPALGVATAGLVVGLLRRRRRSL